MREVDVDAFARRVSERLEKRSLSQSAAAKTLHIPQQSMQNVCAGKVKNPRFINELADLLLTTRVWLLYGEPPETVIPHGLRERAANALNAIADIRLMEAIEALEALTPPSSGKTAYTGKSKAKKRVA